MIRNSFIILLLSLATFFSNSKRVSAQDGTQQASSRFQTYVYAGFWNLGIKQNTEIGKRQSATVEIGYGTNILNSEFLKNPDVYTRGGTMQLPDAGFFGFIRVWSSFYTIVDYRYYFHVPRNSTSSYNEGFYCGLLAKYTGAERTLHDYPESTIMPTYCGLFNVGVQNNFSEDRGMINSNLGVGFLSNSTLKERDIRVMLSIKFGFRVFKF